MMEVDAIEDPLPNTSPSKKKKFPYGTRTTPFTDDPRPTLRAAVQYLTDTELSNMLISRLSQATQLYAPPLYLSFRCLEGLHNFFRAPSPIVDLLIEKSTVSNQSTAASISQFPPVTFTRRDIGNYSRILNGLEELDEEDEVSVLGGYDAMIQAAREKCNSTPTVANPQGPIVWNSLATLISFLKPAELRQLILARIDEAQEPYEELGYLVEFMNSGADVPPGLVIKARYSARRRITRTLHKMKKGSLKKVQQQPQQQGKHQAILPEPPKSTKKKRRKKKKAGAPDAAFVAP